MNATAPTSGNAPATINASASWSRSEEGSSLRSRGPSHGSSASTTPKPP